MYQFDNAFSVVFPSFGDDLHGGISNKCKDKTQCIPAVFQHDLKKMEKQRQV